MALRFRPHHFLCALGFRGAGYSDDFTANMAALVLPMKADPTTEIEVVPAADALCGPCPKRRGMGCTSQGKIDRLDAAHAARLDLMPGERLTWAEAELRIAARVHPGDLSTLCAGCQWLGHGYCEGALADLHARKNAAPEGGVCNT